MLSCTASKCVVMFLGDMTRQLGTSRRDAGLDNSIPQHMIRGLLFQAKGKRFFIYEVLFQM